MADIPLDDFTDEYLEALGLDLGFSLHDCQKRAVEIIMQDSGVLVVIPTGKGKTLLSVAASLYSREIKHKKSMLAAPLRALTTEHVETYNEYGIRTMIDNGEHPKTISDYYKDDYDCIVTTYEKMDSIIRNYNNKYRLQKRDIIFNQIDTLIIDEIHSIEDESRGVNLESFIMSVKYLYPHIKIVGLSATIGNYEEFADWLGVPVVYEPASERPVPLEINYVQVESYYAKEQYAEKMELLINHISEDPNAKRMIAVTAVRRTYGIAYALCGETTTTKLKLENFMRRFRVGWHYSDMPIDDRMAVEWAFQYEDLPDEEAYYYESEDLMINRKVWLWDRYKLDHGIDILVCTPTLIVGRNLPVTYIDIFDYIQFTYKAGPVIIGPNRLQQTIGRAGRQKFANGDPNYKGVATIYVHYKDYYEVKQNAEKPFDIVSHLNKHLGEKILAWINSRIVKNERDIYKFLSNALDKNIKDNEKLKEKELQFLIKHKFISRDDANQDLIILNKGLKTIRHYIQPRTVVRWGALLAQYINNKENKVKLNKFLSESMDIEEYYGSISVMAKEEQVINQMSSYLNNPDIAPQAIKSFIFCFPTYSKKMLNLTDKDYTIPEEESNSTRAQFKRMILAFSDVYSHTSFRKVLETCVHMVDAGKFNPKIAALMSINGIGSEYAGRLYKAGIDTPKKLVKLYLTDRRQLMVITQMNATKLKKVIDGIKLRKQSVKVFGGKK